MSKYSKEFKLEVVKHYASFNDGFRTTGAKFAIDYSLVRRWVDVHKCHGPDGFGPRYARRTAEFKLNVLKQIQSRGLSLREARREFNIGTESPTLVVIVTITSKLSRLAQYGRLFFNKHPIPLDAQRKPVCRPSERFKWHQVWPASCIKL